MKSEGKRGDAGATGMRTWQAVVRSSSDAPGRSRTATTASGPPARPAARLFSLLTRHSLHLCEGRSNHNE